MKSAWKWILLFVGVLVVAFCVSLPLFLRGLMGFGFGRMPMLFRHGGGFPRMGGGGFFGFGLLRFIGPLFALVVLGLLVWGVVWLVRRGNRLAPAVTPAAPAEPIPPSEAVTPIEPVETSPCTNCGKPLQSGWVACPYCGQKV
jgi:hypothetical protein